jgi:predicted transcriptional regulator
MTNCQNPYESYGEICVGCNCCGRFGEDTMWQARYELAIRVLNEKIEHLQSEYFKSNLQQANICSSISYWSEKLKEILTHLDFDKEKGATDERN